MSDNKVISPFQAIDWRILQLRFHNNLINPPQDIPQIWTLRAHIDKQRNESNEITGALHIQFQIKEEYNNQELEISGDAASFHILKTNEEKDADIRFDKLMCTNAMVWSLSNLRVSLMQAGGLFQFGTKALLLPFIDLNNFEFDKEIIITV